MKVFITGAGGQLGTELAALCATVGDDVIAVTSAELDITDRDQVHAAVGSTGPDAVFNCAAWTAVDACESDPDKAFAVNAMGPRWVAEAAGRAGAHLVHVSTDYVFDGTKAGPYHEWDATGPRSVYGASKLAGEFEAAAAPSSTVVRTAWVMGNHGVNMLQKVIGWKDRTDLAFVDDQRGSPTFTADLASGLRRAAADRLSGLYHLTNTGSVTWYEFVRDTIVALGGSADQVRPIATAELDPPPPAPRPANSVLANTAWLGAGMVPLPEYREALDRTLAERTP